ncbi:MAG: HNH endonuclease [Bacteroidales bacterium]|nr:HNH endonuclease [Candidatus Sodaliphilus fimicaballi]
MEWTREQEIIALYMYCLIPFNKVSGTNPQIVEMAKIIGRPNANSLKAKIGNFGKFDTNLEAVGLGHTSHLDEEIWNEYNGRWQELEVDALKLIDRFQSRTIDPLCNIQNIPIGEERETIIRQRTNQNLFRNMVLSAYNNTCCITGIARPELVEACHIVDWKEDANNRINPCNGLAMNVLFHRAYDKFYIGISPDLRVVVSDRLYDDIKGINKDNTYAMFNPFNGSQITLPKKFKPNIEFIEKHFCKFKNMI